jgi:Leucine-rich repeat (LRR) protein
MNGITEKNMRNIDKITKIELVLEQFPNMDILQIFNNLQELTLINVEIETITGLDDLYNLRDLWLSEN